MKDNTWNKPKEYALRAKEYTCGASTSSNINKTNKKDLNPFANAAGKEYGCVAHSTAKGTQGEPCFTRMPLINYQPESEQ